MSSGNPLRDIVKNQALISTPPTVKMILIPMMKKIVRSVERCFYLASENIRLVGRNYISYLAQLLGTVKYQGSIWLSSSYY